jgi:hypothetical protein
VFFLTGIPDRFRIAGYLAILIGAWFLIVGVQQWLVLSKWTKRYKTYKEKQKRIQKQLDFEGDDSVQKS